MYLVFCTSVLTPLLRALINALSKDSLSDRDSLSDKDRSSMPIFSIMLKTFHGTSWEQRNRCFIDPFHFLTWRETLTTSWPRALGV